MKYLSTPYQLSQVDHGQSETSSLDHSPHQLQGAIHAKKVPKIKRKYTVVPNESRIQIIIAISEFGLNCLQASKLLNIPYVNTMIIYRQFKLDNKVVSQAKHHRTSEG